jgi:hypothetical protein
MQQLFTSRKSIYISLRAAFPEGHYHPGAALEGFENLSGQVRADIAGHGGVESHLHVCAEVAQSETRRRLLPQASRFKPDITPGRARSTKHPHHLIWSRSSRKPSLFPRQRGGHMLVYLMW